MEVSIIVPVYKAEKVIERCVESILNQTFHDFELILIDDGSPDNCGKICDRYAKKNYRVKVIHQSNKGVSAARNAGLDIALGKYILFVDSDDYVDSNYIAQFFEQKSDLNACGFVVENESGNILYSNEHQAMYYTERSLIDYPKLYEDNVLYSPYCKLFVCDIIRTHNLRFAQHITWGEDGMFVADYLQYVDSVIVSDYLGYHYVKYDAEDSLSTRIREDVINMIGVSRLYCIEKMLITSPNNYEAVYKVCIEDMKKNSTYFVRKLFENTEISMKQKIKILEIYMEENYLADTFKKANIYYSGRKKYCIALGKKNAPAIIYTYYFETKKEAIYELIYKIYDIIPEKIKNIYRYIKRVKR